MKRVLTLCLSALFIRMLNIFGKRIVLVCCGLVLCITASFAQQTVKVTGTVTDETNAPIISAGVFQTGTSNGTVTDELGNYSISVPEGAVLEVSALSND